MSKSIYALTDEAKALDALLDEHLTLSGGELTPEVEAILNEWLADTKTSIDDKLDAYAAVIAEKTALAEARKAEAARYLQLARTDENTVASLKERLRWFFEINGMDKRETLHHKFTLAAGGKAPVIVELDAEELPIKYRRIKWEIDKTAIAEFLEAGGTLPWARLGERRKSLRIK